MNEQLAMIGMRSKPRWEKVIPGPGPGHGMVHGDAPREWAVILWFSLG
jgi:hypothetical protein